MYKLLCSTKVSEYKLAEKIMLIQKSDSHGYMGYKFHKLLMSISTHVDWPESLLTVILFQIVG